MEGTNENKDMLIGNEIELDEVLEMARKIVEQSKQESEMRMAQFRNIVEGVARKYASKWCDREDLEQELWVTVLELIENCGGEQNVDPRLVAKSCFNKAVDFYRYHRRRYDSKVAMIEEKESDEAPEWESKVSGSNELMISKGRTGYEEAVLREIIDLFPKGSRERKYVVIKLYMHGEIDESTGLEDKLELPEDDREESIIKLLGFNSRYPSSWGKLKYAIRERIYRYLGLLPDEGEPIDEHKQLDLVRERVECIFSETNGGYIGLDKLAKDKVVILLGGNADLIWKAMKKSKKLLRGLTCDGGKFVMKNEERYLKNSAKNADVILDQNAD